MEVDGRESIKALIGCDKFTVAHELPDDHTLFVNDAGWLPIKDAPQHSFCICPFPRLAMSTWSLPVMGSWSVLITAGIIRTGQLT